MKIGLNARFLTHPHTGVGQYTWHLIHALAEHDKEENEYFIFTPELVDMNLPDRFRQIRVPERPYASKSLAKAHWEQILVPNEMEKWGVDLAHFLYPSNPLKSLGIPTVVTVHDVIPWVLPEYRERLRSRVYHAYTSLALKKANHFITVSEFSKGEIEKTLKIKEKNITVIPLAPPRAFSQPLNNPPLRKEFLLYVGGYDPRKNVPLLMEAYQKYIANYYPVDLVLVGGEGRGLEAFFTDIHQNKVAGKFPVKTKGRLIMTPSLSDTELAYLYKEAKAFVHASDYEGFNLPLVEAMSFGLPMLVADTPVNREVTGGAAYFADTTTVDTFGIGLHEFMNNRAMRDDLKRKSAQRSKDFSWEKCVEETLYVYHLFG